MTGLVVVRDSKLALVLLFLSFLYSAISSMFSLCFRCAYFFTLFIRACCRVLHTFILNVIVAYVLQFVCLFALVGPYFVTGGTWYYLVALVVVDWML